MSSPLWRYRVMDPLERSETRTPEQLKEAISHIAKMWGGYEDYWPYEELHRRIDNGQIKTYYDLNEHYRIPRMFYL